MRIESNVFITPIMEEKYHYAHTRTHTRTHTHTHIYTTHTLNNKQTYKQIL